MSRTIRLTLDVEVPGSTTMSDEEYLDEAAAYIIEAISEDTGMDVGIPAGPIFVEAGASCPDLGQGCRLPAGLAPRPDEHRYEVDSRQAGSP